ncbi:uncharacterized protein LOC128736349 [Sabethes cyaneus]|uniref:uncharacterized protein LOC128736349 n=1 Tax=Sabethes cyaneus TaxID=53552 RepID=UPI00237D9A1D|nr:uncharacterized protein LOC128736349 [Sabethes cyaneus]
MKSVTVVAVLLSVLLTQKSCAITNNADKKVSPNGGVDQSVTFSSYGEDQLIFKDSSFQLRNDGSQKVQQPIRRISDENSAYELFEAGWRPLYSFKFENGMEKFADQLPQEDTLHPAVETNFVTKNTKYLRFLESDIMPLADQMKPQISENMIKLGSESESEEEYDDSSVQSSEENLFIVNTTDMHPRMFKFEESDRMKFPSDSPNMVKLPNEVSTEEPGNVEESQQANYDVFVIENLMKNTSSSLRFENDKQQNDTSSSSQLHNLPVTGVTRTNYNDSPRNSSRFFRFEEPKIFTEKPRVEKSPMNSFYFYDHDSPRNEFRFPTSEVSAKKEIPHKMPGNAIKFLETDSRPQGISSSQMRFDDDKTRPLKFTDNTQVRPQIDSDQFYTVKATIQIGNWGGSADSITPPTVSNPIATRIPKKKKGKIYNQHMVDIRKQDEFSYQQPPDYDNYLQNSPQTQTPINQYQSNLPISPTPQIPSNNPYYQNLPNPGTPYPPYDPNNYYIQDYLTNYPYPNPNQHQLQADGSRPYPSLYPQYPNVPTNLITGGQTDSPLSAQSIFGFLQSIFNFAPGTFGNFPASGNHDSAQSPSTSTSQTVNSPIMAVSTQLRKALDNISGNDDLQCVPKLICMMSRRSSGQGFSTYVNRGLLSTILSAVPDSSPWLKFSRAALLGYGIGANSCDVYYPKCPKDESEIIYYLNNHRGGFFRFFNDEHNSASKG